MPELPDIAIYIEALEQRIAGQTLEHVQIASPFLLRTAVPPINSVEGRKVVELRRLGKRICVGFEDDLWLVLHLMIAGRLHWREDASRTRTSRVSSGRSATAKPKLSRSPKNPGLAAFQFHNGTLSLTEAGSQRRASLHLVEGKAGLERLDPGGLEVLDADLETFARTLTSSNHTLKRALTDPRLFSGIGNAYSDEILFHARLSPIALTQKLTAEQIERLFAATCTTLNDWLERLRAEVSSLSPAVPDSDVTKAVSLRARGRSSSARKRGSSPTPGSSAGETDWGGAAKEGSSSTQSAVTAQQLAFPEKVTAFRDGMTVHGRYKQPCLICNAKIQRIRYASNETNYCPNCQTGGRLLADRSLSRLLRADWPRTVEEFEGLIKK